MNLRSHTSSIAPPHGAQRRLACTLATALALCAFALPPATAQGAAHVYTPGAFDAIEISGSAAIRFVQGATDQISIEGDDDAQRSVRIEVRDGTLRLHPGGAWKFWNNDRAQIVVTARQLRRVGISGAADFRATDPVRTDELAVNISGAGAARFDQLQAGELNFVVSGAGNGQFAGQTKELTVRISGKSEFRGENLASDDATVQISGIGNVQVWATKALEVSVSGIGTVDFWGAPASFERRVSGSATVNDRGPKRAP